MAGFEKTMGQMPAGNTRRTYGTAYWDGSKWFVNVGGNLLTCRWLDPIQPLQGGKLVVDITDDGQGQSTALVIGGYADQPRPSTGVVLAVGITDIVLTGEDGATYTTDRFIGTYTVGAMVYVTWDAAKPTILGVIPNITVTPPGNTVPPPAGPDSGVATMIATASDTWSTNGWGRWATSQYGGEDVYSGTWGGYTVTGSWFYGAAKPELAGKTVTSIRFRLPQRLNVGATGTDTVHLYAHTSGSRPGTDVTRTVGPFDVSVAQGAAAQWVDLPLTFAPALAAGGGISIAGDPYTGFTSRLKDAESGKLTLTWSS